MYSTLLFPTDGSQGAAEALDHAVDIARTYGATLHALHVVTAGDGLTDERGSNGTESEAAVERVRERGADAGVEVVTSVEHGDPADVILTYAATEGIDLVVMATRGRTGLDRYVLGSVTEEIVRSSDVPVLTVRMD